MSGRRKIPTVTILLIDSETSQRTQVLDDIIRKKKNQINVNPHHFSRFLSSSSSIIHKSLWIQRKLGTNVSFWRFLAVDYHPNKEEVKNHSS